MKEPISIKEILAVVLKRGTAIICVALICAILLGGVQGISQLRAVRNPANTAEQVAQRNKDALATYQAQYDLAQSTLEKVQYKLEKQKEYNEESLLMQIDPYNKYRSYVILALTEVEEDAFQQIYEQEGTPVDYIITKILSQYMLYWKHMDLMTELENNPYPEANEKYIREVANVSRTDGGTITIYVNAQTPEEASVLCQSICDKLLSMQSTIQDATYAHELTVISSGTKFEVDYSIDEKQIINRESEDTYQQEILDIQAARNKLKKPAVETVKTMRSVVTTAVKWAVIGGVVGFAMACACVWLLYILSDGVETSRQAEAILGLSYLGNAGKKGNIFVRLANRFVGEVQWKDREQAVQYIGENLRSSLQNTKKIALVSTLPVAEEDAGIQMLLQMVREQGHTITFVSKAEENPAAIAALRESDHAILAERLGRSNRNAMLHVKTRAEQLDAQVLGFVLI